MGDRIGDEATESERGDAGTRGRVKVVRLGFASQMESRAGSDDKRNGRQTDASGGGGEPGPAAKKYYG
jgi:hypothetical protein